MPRGQQGQKALGLSCPTDLGSNVTAVHYKGVCSMSFVVEMNGEEDDGYEVVLEDGNK